TRSLVIPAEPHPQSLPGLTRQSIDLRKGFLRRRWMPGSSPGMTSRKDVRWNGVQNLRRSRSCQAVPARIGPEALAVALREAFEVGADVGDTARARVVHGPAAERRERGGEGQGAVERTLVRHHALAQTGDADIEHGKNEAVRHLRRGLGCLALLHRFAPPPLVEASAALAAELTHLDLVAQHPR